MLWMLWYGGSSYCVPHPMTDAEPVASMAEAIAVFEGRRDNCLSPETPCVDNTAEADVFLINPQGYSDPVPIYVLGVGADGETVCESGQDIYGGQPSGGWVYFFTTQRSQQQADLGAAWLD